MAPITLTITVDSMDDFEAFIHGDIGPTSETFIRWADMLSTAKLLITDNEGVDVGRMSVNVANEGDRCECGETAHVCWDTGIRVR